MKPIADKIRSSSMVAIVALSVGALWCVLLLFDRLGRLMELAAAADMWTALSHQGYRLLPSLFHLALLLAIAQVGISLFVTIRKQGTPFVTSVPRRMKLIAILVFLFTAAPNWVYYILRGVHEGGASFAIIENEGIIGLIFAAVLYALAMIFQYGCQLQQESDETL